MATTDDTTTEPATPTEAGAEMDAALARAFGLGTLILSAKPARYPAYSTDDGDALTLAREIGRRGGTVEIKMQTPHAWERATEAVAREPGDPARFRVVRRPDGPVLYEVEVCWKDHAASASGLAMPLALCRAALAAVAAEGGEK